MSTPTKTSSSRNAPSTPSGKHASPKQASNPSSPTSPDGPKIMAVHMQPLPNRDDPSWPNPKNVQTNYDLFPIRKPIADSLDWHNSTVSTAFGLPAYKLARWPGPNAKAKNFMATGLFVCADLADLDNFGKVQFQRVTGGVVVARVDEREVAVVEIERLTQYLGSISKDLYDFAHGEMTFDNEEAKRAKAVEMAGRLLTKQAFDAYLTTR